MKTLIYYCLFVAAAMYVHAQEPQPIPLYYGNPSFGATCSGAPSNPIVFVSPSGAMVTCKGDPAVWTSVTGTGTVTSVTGACGINGTVTGSGTLTGSELTDSETGSSPFTIPASACGKTIQRNNASAVADPIGQAGTGGYVNGWFVDYQCSGAGGCTITPATSTIGGQASLVLVQGEGRRIISDGTNYRVQSGGVTSPIPLSDLATQAAYTILCNPNGIVSSPIACAPSTAGTLVSPFQFLPGSIAAVIGDGNSHPLSAVYGSLGAAQADYPTATSLSNEFFCLAVQNALIASQRVYIPTATATYLCNTTVTMTRNQSVFSFHQGGQEAVGASINDGPVITAKFAGPLFLETGFGELISGLTLQGQEGASPYNTNGGSLIQLTNGSTGRIEHMMLRYATYPIIATGNNTQEWFIQDNFIWYAYDPIHVASGGALTDSRISGNEIWASNIGIDASSSCTGCLTDSIISNNIIFGNGPGVNAMQVQNSVGLAIHGNRFDTFTDACLYVVGESSYISITGNAFIGCGSSTAAGGVHIFPASGGQVADHIAMSGNAYNGNASRDILLNNFAGTITNSVIIDAGLIQEYSATALTPINSTILGIAPNNGASSVSVLPWLTVNGVASITPPPTTNTGTSGTAICSQSLQGTLKTATCYLSGYAETGSAQTYSFAVAFSTTPILLMSGGSCGTYNPTSTASVLTLPANAAMTAETCNIALIGQ